jgi:hypothetical protein
MQSESNQTKTPDQKRRDKWLKRLGREFLNLDGPFPFNGPLPSEKSPEWVDRVEREYIAATYSRADVKNITRLTPKSFGAFLGYQCAYAVWMVETFDDDIEKAGEHPEKLIDLKLTAAQNEKGLLMLRRFSAWYEALRRLAGRALKSCVYQPYPDMSDFLTGYSQAFSKKPKLGASWGDFGNGAFRIYHFMLLHWHTVEHLDSVRSLHDLLRKCLGESLVGDLKRVEKICQRIGLHYRKPGRPRRPNNSDNTPVALSV